MLKVKTFLQHLCVMLQLVKVNNKIPETGNEQLIHHAQAVL
jgi:hypothetical protein